MAEEPANFLPALGHDLFFLAAPSTAPCFFFQQLRLQGAQNTRLRPAPASPALVLDLEHFSC